MTHKLIITTKDVNTLKAILYAIKHGNAIQDILCNHFDYTRRKAGHAINRLVFTVNRTGTPKEPKAKPLPEPYVVCGIVEQDLVNYLTMENLLDKIPSEKYEQILTYIGSAYHFDGSGLHGWELIAYVVNEHLAEEANQCEQKPQS